MSEKRVIPIVLAALALGSVAAEAQDLAARPRRHSAKGLRMHSALYDAQEYARPLVQAARAQNQALPIQALKTNLRARGLNLRDDAKVQVEIVGPAGAAAVDPKVLARFGGEVSNSWQNRADTWIPVEAVTDLAQALPAGYVMERADPGGLDAVGGEGAAAINSDSYRDAGQNGAGLTIAVIDSGFANFTMARNASDAPPAARTVAINYAAAPWEDNVNDTQHGTACVEAAFDHASGANYRLYKTDSLTDLGTAVNDCIANGVDVITHSMSRYNTGWSDNSGAACSAALLAANAGILFFTSAGNRAQQHWQGSYNDPENDDWHNFSGGDETINIVVAPNGGGNFYLQWTGDSDYDLFLYDQDTTTVLASSESGGNTFESFFWTSPFGSNRTVHLAVLDDGGDRPQFEIFLHSSGTVVSFQYAQAAGSTTSPSNTTNANVISVGAVPVNSWGSASGTSGIIANYSSQGPSNRGMTLPNLSGTTNTNTTAYGGAFSGTSAATPNCAGAACVFWDAHPGYSSSAIRWLILEQAALWRDWGAGGNDNIYGRGGMLLIDYAANTRWVARGYNNVGESTTGPNYTVQAGYDQATSGGRLLLFPGGSFPEPVNMLGTKSLSVQNVENAANLGF